MQKNASQQDQGFPFLETFLELNFLAIPSFKPSECNDCDRNSVKIICSIYSQDEKEHGGRPWWSSD